MVAGYWRRASTERKGLRTNSPPQFGHLPCKRAVAHEQQNVHSNEQIIASRELGGRSRSQHSQFGFMSSMVVHRLPISGAIVAAADHSRAVRFRRTGFDQLLQSGDLLAEHVVDGLCDLVEALPGVAADGVVESEV